MGHECRAFEHFRIVARTTPNELVYFMGDERIGTMVAIDIVKARPTGNGLVRLNGSVVKAKGIGAVDLGLFFRELMTRINNFCVAIVVKIKTPKVRRPR